MTEKFPTDWDIDQYYDEMEPEEHWELRKAFMEVHKDKFPEDYLVALATTFTNIELLGCIYPAPLMLRIEELSKDVGSYLKKYRELKKTKLQRTFQSASSAAEKKVAGKRHSDPERYHKTNKMH
ncbi:partner of xrn-2 protein 1 [Onthophagus taurus]|uniref:partner of xrn-2 protein 1 n=1 Tax=Onthophagus taurus TaxID=166361 RepID=UPI000C201D90|nr:partner of xrn-2 protein 1 [Onthophagus taurus]